MVSHHLKHPDQIIGMEQLSSRFKEQLEAYWKREIENYRVTLDKESVELFFT